MSREPRAPRKQRSGPSSMETALVLMLGAMLSSGCLLFVLVLSPAFLWVGVVAGGIFLMAGLHYLLWGRLVRGMSERAEEEGVEEAWWQVDRLSEEPPLLPRDDFE
jgi:hypothetical protein